MAFVPLNTTYLEIAPNFTYIRDERTSEQMQHAVSVTWPNSDRWAHREIKQEYKLGDNFSICYLRRHQDNIA
jgi:hypothetical protein